MIGESGLVLKRWMERAKGAALFGAAAAVIASGYAFAVSPIIEGGRNFAGSVNILASGQGGVIDGIYTVPAGQQYTLTDIVVANDSPSTTAWAQILSGSESSCIGGPPALRLNSIRIPPGTTLHIPLNTGFGFAAGRTVCLDADLGTQWTIRGYLSNAI